LEKVCNLIDAHCKLRRSEEREWSETHDVSPEFFGYFRIPNSLFLNHRLIYGFLKGFLDRERENSILDVGCGGGDLMQYLAVHLRKDGFRFSLTGVDVNSAAVGVAEARTKAWRNARVIYGQVEETGGIYDVAVASQILHHFSPADAANMLKSVYAKVSRGIVISDLLRSRAAYWLVKAAVYATTTDRMHRHDGPLSVLRSYTDEEIGRIMKDAGISSFSIRNLFPRKFIVVAKGSN
jgi:2-polyprenyl-3-methyl-5-hydroxy-6-metoxy-1,4-benzoquinol methylase